MTEPATDANNFTNHHDHHDAHDHHDHHAPPPSHILSSPPASSLSILTGSVSRGHRASIDEVDAPAFANGPSLSSTQPASRPQRPSVPTRTPSHTYAPTRKPQSSQPFVEPVRPPPKAKPHRTGDRHRSQEKAYLQKLRQNYFDPLSGSSRPVDSDSEGETPLSETAFEDRHENEAIMFYGNDDVLPNDEDLTDPVNRERLEWQRMLNTVLTGDVFRQEKKRLFGSTEQQVGDAAHKNEVWLGVRASVCGRHVAVQRRLVEDARAETDRIIDEIINFQIKGESEVGKPPSEQVKDIIRTIEKCEALYPSSATLATAHRSANWDLFQESYDAIVSWHNTSELINTQLAILRKWVGNDDLDLTRGRDNSPLGAGLAGPDSFLDRLLKDDGIKLLYKTVNVDQRKSDGSFDHEFTAVKSATDLAVLSSRAQLQKRETGMLAGLSTVIKKAKRTLILNASSFQKRHLPAYNEELLTLIAFPSRLIEEIIRLRLAYAKKLKDPSQQNDMMQDQMIAQLRLLLGLAIRIKQEYQAIAQAEPGWDLPQLVDESFDQIVLDALRHYFKTLNWKLGSSSKISFRGAELLSQEWPFANEIGRHLQGGDVEVAEQFTTLTYKALYRLSQTLERELRAIEDEDVVELGKSYAQALDWVRVRQRMLQRFSKMLSDNYEHACEYSIAFSPNRLHVFLERLATSGHFLVHSDAVERDGVLVLASPALRVRLGEVQSILAVRSLARYEPEDDAYVLVVRPENAPTWFGDVADDVTVALRGQISDLQLGHARLCAGGSRTRLEWARPIFLDAVDMHVDLVMEQRSVMPKVSSRLMEIRKVAYKLSNAFMDSIEVMRRRTAGKDCQELIHSCFGFATDFGRRSLLIMDSNRRQMTNIKLTKLALDWVGFICDDCEAGDRRTFGWAVHALEFATLVTSGRHILALDEDEYARLRSRVAGCMAVLISHFDIMGARSSLAAQAERDRVELLLGQFRQLDQNTLLDDDEAARSTSARRMDQLDRVDDCWREKEAGRQVLGRVLEANNEVDRSLAYLSSAVTSAPIRWQLGTFVGGGTFGSVYSAVNLESGQLMAVKEIRLQDPKLIPTIAGQIREEMRVLQVLDHPNVVSYSGIEVHRDRVYIFMEFCSGGSLAGLLEHGRIEDEQVIMVYALQLLEGLTYLHESGIVHRDIKPENILLDHNGVIKYVDFGAAKVIARQGRTLISDLAATKPNKSMTGTPMYMSPEVIKGENPGRPGAVDVWSLGCVVLEMATGRRAWAQLDNEWAIMYNIAQGNPPQLPGPDQLSPAGIDFLRRCFTRDPRMRASALELLQHDWIVTIRSQVVGPITPSDTCTSSGSGSYMAASTGSSSNMFSLPS